jgi:hypothetical protein
MKYLKQKKSISYFIQYGTPYHEFNFGKIVAFFSLNNRQLALIHHFINYKPFGTYFKESSYYNMIKQPMDLYYFVLKETNISRVIEVDDIMTYVIPFKNTRNVSTIIVTPICSSNEHD